MNAWIEWARGPLFVFAFTFMLLGLLRLLVVTVWETRRTLKRAGDKNIPYGKLLLATLKWLFPLSKLRAQVVFSLTSMIFHVAILLVPIFLAGHISLWARGLGVSWPAIPNSFADVLTWVAVVTAVALVLQRLASRATRKLSRPQDYLLPLIVAVPFVSGYLMMHPKCNPFSFEATFLVHLLSANLVFILMPITKLSHVSLIPVLQTVSEIAWHWPADAGSKVGVTLGKEEEPI